MKCEKRQISQIKTKEGLRTDVLYMVPTDLPFAAEVPKGRWFRHLMPPEDLGL